MSKTTKSKRTRKPETLRRQTMARKFKAWQELSGIGNSVHSEVLQAAFVAGYEAGAAVPVAADAPTA